MRISTLFVMGIFALLCSTAALADTVNGTHSTLQINFNSGFDDATSVSAVGGNSGTTVGQQRKNAYLAAAQIIADELYSPVTIIVDASFANIGCDAVSATLGSAGASANLYNSSTPAGITANTWYPIGLWNAIAGSDVSGAYSDITSQFNSDIGTTGCLEGSNGWYYGFDTPPANYIGFFTVLLHEMTHGLGFASLVNISDGIKSGGLDDVFSNFLYSQSNGAWPGLSDAQRASSITSVTGLLWDGANVNTAAAALSGGAALTGGFHDADSSSTFTSGDRMQMYAPASLEGGSSVSHFNTTASPNELMEPQYTDYLDSLGLALYVLKDIGWTVYPPSASNNAPVMTAVGAQNTDEDTPLAITLAATDADGDSLSYSVPAACATSISCAISGTSLTMTPAANFHGSGSITVTVSDGNGGSDTDTFTLTVNSVNDAPVFSAVGAQTTNEDTAKTITLTATDADNDSLSYSVPAACATSISCAVSGTSLTMTPAANFHGSGSITVTVSDGNGGSDTDTFTLTVNSVNDAPVFSAVGAQTTNEDTAKTITLAATDADGDSLSYSVSAACATNISCAVSGTSLTMTPAANFHGSGSITVTVSDGNGGSDTDTFTLTVNSVNDAPVLTNPGSRSMSTNDSLNIALGAYASDVDGDSLTFSVLCSGLSCVVSGNNLNLSTDGSFSGGSVTLTVTDTASGSASQTFTVNLSSGYSLDISHNGSPLTSGTQIGLLDYSFSLGNDHGQYSLSAYLDGQDVSELLSAANSVYSLNMPSSGTFAGSYDVVIYDADAGITTHLELIRPPRISLNHSALLSGESHYQLDIEGAAPATDFDLSSSDSSVSFEDELGNPISTSSAGNNAASFNRASAWLVVSSNVQSSTTLTASASAYADVSINDVPVYPAINYSLHLQNSQGDPLPGSLILNDSNLLTDLGIGLDAETNNGDLSLNLPADTTVTGTASATDYTDADFTLDGSNADVTITLAENAVPVTISGTISGNGGLDFEQEAPLVSIKLSNNQTLTVPVTVDSASQASFSKQLDLNSQSPSSLTISHSQTATATLSLANVSTDKHFTVNMVKVSSDTSVTVVTSTNIGSKKGGAVLSYLLLCALPLMWRRRKNQQY